VPSATILVPAAWTFLVGPVKFQGPCAPQRITVMVRDQPLITSCTLAPKRSGYKKMDI
jgi:hypothetical protein